MRPVAAIIEAAVDIGQLAREISRSHIELQECDRKLAASERKTESLREEQRRRRVEIGRLLVEAKRGIKHGGWLPYLEKLGIEPRTAQKWMSELEFKYESKANGSHSDDDEEDERDDEPEARPRKKAERSEPDIDKALSNLSDRAYAIAEKRSGDDRKIIAWRLRETARLIEEME